MKTIKFFSFITFIFLPLFAFATPQIVSYKLNGKEENARFSVFVAGDKVNIEVSANVPVKFNTIALCVVADSVCNRSTAVKYFTKTDVFVPSVGKEWDGKTNKGATVAKGDYKIKVTMKDVVGTEKIQELSPYVITVDLPISDASSTSGSKSSVDVESSFEQLRFASSSVSQSNLDNDPIVKKIRDFIANRSGESREIVTSARNNAVIKSSSNQNKKTQDDNSGATTPTKFKKTKSEKRETVSVPIIQAGEVVLSEDSDHESFIWRILNLPFVGVSFIIELFYSGN